MQKFSRKLFILLALLSLTACQLAEDTPVEPSANLVLTNGKIYTMNSEQQWAQAVAISDGKILSIGSNEEIEKYVAQTTKVVDLQQKMVLPSFQDTHVHPMDGGLAYTGCVLFDLNTLNEVLAKIERCVKENPTADFIRGSGWNWGLFVGEGKPNKQLLDAIDSDRPMMFGDSDGHTFWTNSAGLQLAGITRDTPDPEGGEIGRDEVTGEPSGTLLEGPAMDLLEHKFPAYTMAQKEKGMLYAQNYLNGLGITAIQDAYVRLKGNESEKVLDVYRSLQSKGQLNMRVQAALYWEPGQGLKQIEAMKAARKNYSEDRLQVTSVKFWVDGILESYTAMLLEPYTDKPSTSGFLMMPKYELMAAAPLLDAAGFQLHIHAIGDATVRYALDAFEKAQDTNGVRDSRHLTAHTQQVHPDDIGRFAKLNAIAGFSPYWAHYDEYVRDINPAQLGDIRMKQMYPIKEIADTGAHIAFGSDWSVSTADPLLGIETAVSRKDPHSTSNDILLPEQRITLHDAIAGYTSNAAFTNFLETKTGSVEIGKYADLIILSENLFDIPTDKISEVKVLTTLLEGKVIYGKF